MGLVNAGLLLRYCYNYRVIWLAGRYGSGKTALAYRLAYDLMRQYKMRYLLSNVSSVWNDDPDKVVLKDGVTVDAVMILDEAGEFVAGRSDAKDWLSYLRKLNIILILPSVSPPAGDLRTVTIRRSYDAMSIGIPAWYYKMSMQSGDIGEKMAFWWWRPAEVFGVYDTQGFPSEATELLAHVKGWTAAAAGALGYGKTSEKHKQQTTKIIYSQGWSETKQDRALDDIRGEIDSLAEVSAGAQEALSLLIKNKRLGR